MAEKSQSKVAARLSLKKAAAKRRPAAITSDILGEKPRGSRVPSKWRTHHDRLVRLRASLLNRQDDLVKDAREEQDAFSLHMADAGTDSFDRDLALSRASFGQDAVYEIDEALERIRNGTYGRCELTGKPIEAARLEAVPWARYSLEAERDLERQGTVPKVKLAPRAAVPRGGGEPGSEGQDREQE